MTEQPKRGSTREKKLPKYFQADSQEYGIFGTAKNGDSRLTAVKKEEAKTPAQQLNQIAKLLVKFTATVNQRYRDNCQERPTEKQRKKNILGSEDDEKRDIPSKRQDYQSVEGANSIKRLKDPLKDDHHPYDQSKSMQKISGQAAKGKQYAPRSHGPMGMNTDLQYHTLLNDHIRQSFPNMKNLSPEMLMQLGIPVRLEAQATSIKTKVAEKEKQKEKERKKNVVHQIPQKEIKQDLKPFKRQSYHAAIAYHIYLKNVKANPSSSGTAEIDPTYNSKKLREESNRSLEKDHQTKKKEVPKIEETKIEPAPEQIRLEQIKKIADAKQPSSDEAK